MRILLCILVIANADVVLERQTANSRIGDSGSGFVAGKQGGHQKQSRQGLRQCASGHSKMCNGSSTSIGHEVRHTVAAHNAKKPKHETASLKGSAAVSPNRAA